MPASNLFMEKNEKTCTLNTHTHTHSIIQIKQLQHAEREGQLDRALFTRGKMMSTQEVSMALARIAVLAEMVLRQDHD